MPCQLSAIREIQRLMTIGGVLLDSGGEVLGEYRNNASFSAQEVGDQFMVWVHDNEYNEQKCIRQELTPCLTHDFVFEEFPHEDNLRAFDPSDQKFAALAYSSQTPAEVLNAVDSDWKTFEVQLSNAGVTVRNIC